MTQHLSRPLFLLLFFFLSGCATTAPDLLEKDPQKQYLLGARYYTGEGVELDQPRAMFWFQRAAEQGHAEAQYQMGLAQAEGFGGLEANPPLALEWFRKAAIQGHPNAQLLLGVALLEGKVIEKNQEEALEWLVRAAGQGQVKALLLVAKSYLGGYGVAKDELRAVDWFHIAAERGNVEAQLFLGMIYYGGRIVEQDFNQAYFWLKHTAEQGNDEAQYLLATLYEVGKGTPQSLTNALNWYEKAATQGNVRAQRATGLFYARGKGTETAYNAAFKWLSLAAEAGEPDAQYGLATLYITGNGVERNVKTAFAWYEKAAAQGHAKAQQQLDAVGKESIYTEEGHTEITLAIRSGKYAKAIRLIEGGAESDWLVSYKVFSEVAEPDKHVAVWGTEVENDQYPLLAAVAALGEVSVAQALLKKGAQVNARLPDEGSTPLMFAAKMGRLKMVRFLLAEGADPALLTTDSRPRGALELAMELKANDYREEVALELLNPPYASQLLDGGSPLQIRILLETAAYNGLGLVLRKLHESGAKISGRNQWGATLLHYALMGAAPGGKEAALYLMEQGLNPNQHYATDRMLADAKHGRFSPRDRRGGQTPLLLAIDERADALFVEALLKSGADVNLPSLAGVTPMMSATSRGREDLLELFLRYGAAEGSDR